MATGLDEQHQIFASNPDDRRAFEALEEHFFLEGDWESLSSLYRARIEAPTIAADDDQRGSLLFRLGQILEERILVDDQAQGDIHCDYATTLGAGGMFLQTEMRLTRGEIVKLRFRIPGGELLHELETRVTWYHAAREEPNGSIRTPGVGLQFAEPSLTAPLARELEDFAV